VHAQFRQDIVRVRPHSPRADDKASRDGVIAATLRHQAKNLSLSISQSDQPCAGVSGCLPRGRQLRQQRRQLRRVDQELSGCRGTHSRNQVVRRSIFVHEASCSGLDRLDHHRAARMPGHHDDASAWCDSLDPSGGLDPVNVTVDVDIHQDDVWLLGAAHLDGRAPVVDGVGDKLDVRLNAEDAHQGVGEQSMIVADSEPDPLGHPDSALTPAAA
jgi:hypothetical protein